MSISTLLREMKEDHHEIQTQHKEILQVSSNRKAKSINVQSKKLNQHQKKSIRKSLNSVFTSNTENDVVIEQISSISEAVEFDQSTVDICKTSGNSDHTPISDSTVAVQHSEESVGISPIAESFVFDEDQSNESIESYIMSLNQYLSPSSVTSGSVEMTPLSSITTVEMTPSSSPLPAEAEVFVDSVTRDGAKTEEIKAFKLESLVRHLRESIFQVLHSADLDPTSKKLLDALIKMVIEEFYSLHEDRDMVVELFSKNVKIVLLSFVLGILVVSAAFFRFSDGQSCYHGPPPT